MSVRPLFDFIAIGDSTLDVFLHIHHASVACQLHKEQCILCFEYANKIPVEAVVKVPGAGNASNVAVGAERLGLRSAIVSIVGNDEVGQEIIRGWKKAHVATTYVRVDPKAETNYSTVLDFHGERTILVYSRPRRYTLPDLDGAHWIYYTALGPGHAKLERQLLKHLSKHPAQRLVFNPGSKQLERNLRSLTPVIARSSVFIVNKEEAMRLLEDGDRPMGNLLLSFHRLGAEIVVITDGRNGSYATDGKRSWFCPVFPGKTVEMTGAGDSYGIGFVSALFHGHDVPDAMRWGSANAWSVVKKIGPQAGLLNKKEMVGLLKQFRRVQPKLLEL